MPKKEDRINKAEIKETLTDLWDGFSEGTYGKMDDPQDVSYAADRCWEVIKYVSGIAEKELYPYLWELAKQEGKPFTAKKKIERKTLTPPSGRKEMGNPADYYRSDIEGAWKQVISALKAKLDNYDSVKNLYDALQNLAGWMKSLSEIFDEMGDYLEIPQLIKWSEEGKMEDRRLERAIKSLQESVKELGEAKPGDTPSGAEIAKIAGKGDKIMKATRDATRDLLQGYPDLSDEAKIESLDKLAVQFKSMINIIIDDEKNQVRAGRRDTRMYRPSRWGM